MKLSSKQYDLGFLESDFKNADFKLFASDDALCYLSCIVCCFKTGEELASKWRVVQNLVSGYYQPSSELALWNIYLVFFCTESLTAWEKYEIQNDKYAVRKVVLDGMNKFPDTAQTETILNNHLLGADLQLTKNSEKKEITQSLTMTEYVRGAPLELDKESREKRAEMIDNIIGFLNKNENQES